jgi:hypothetical protein
MNFCEKCGGLKPEPINLISLAAASTATQITHTCMCPTPLSTMSTSMECEVVIDGQLYKGILYLTEKKEDK